MSFSFDGANMILGKNNGVVAIKLINKNSYLFVNYYIVHRLVFQLKNKQLFVILIKEIYSFFSNSEKRTDTLKQFQSVLDYPILKIKNI